jgi:hypothetical protein
MDINYTAVVSLAIVGFCVMYYMLLQGFISSAESNKGFIDQIDRTVSVFFALALSATLTTTAIVLTVALSAHTPSAMIFMVAVPALVVITVRLTQ